MGGVVNNNKCSNHDGHQRLRMMTMLVVIMMIGDGDVDGSGSSSCCGGDCDFYLV